MEGILSKWIGFLSGWNEKYFVLHNGTLSCFASKDDRLNGIPAKETFNLGLCEINVDQVTPTQFELKGTVDSKVWSLKTETAGERQKWIQALGSAKACLLDSSSLGYLGKSSENTELLSSSGIRKTSTNDCETLATSFDSISFETNETTADENGTGSMNNLLLSSENRSVQEEPETKLELQSIIQLCEQTKADITFLQNVFGHAPVNVGEMEAMIGRLEITLQNFIQTIKLNKSVLCGDEVVEHSISEVTKENSPKEEKSDEFSTFFSSCEVNFGDVVASTISREGKPHIPLETFLSACQCYIVYFDRFSGTAMSPLRADIQSNILKIRTEMKNSPIKYEYLEEMVAHQISTKQHTGPNTSTQALLWLNRALSVMSTFLRKLVSSDSATKYDTGASFVLAYDEMLAKHHNWMVQRLFKIGLKMVPLYSAFKQNMIDKRCWEAAQQSGDPDWEDQIERKMIGHAREYCGHMASVASQIRQMYKTHNIDP